MTAVPLQRTHIATAASAREGGGRQGKGGAAGLRRSGQLRRVLRNVVLLLFPGFSVLLRVVMVGAVRAVLGAVRAVTAVTVVVVVFAVLFVLALFDGTELEQSLGNVENVFGDLKQIGSKHKLENL